MSVSQTVSTGIRRAVGGIEETASGAKTTASMAVDAADYRLEKERSADAGLAGQFNRIVTAAVTLIIGLLVYSEISSSLPDVGGDLGNATDAVDSNTGTAFTLGAVGLLVAAAVVILRMIQGGMGGGNGGGM